MKRLICLTMFLGAIGAMAQMGYKTYPEQMERLDRGVVALPAQDEGIFISWRLLGTDAKGTTFDLLRDGKTIAKGLKATNYTDKKGTSTSRYAVVTHPTSATSPLTSNDVTPWPNLYRSISLDRPEGGNTPDGRSYQYRPNDCSVGDVDGDGQYELFLKWDPSNAHDNAHDGYTGDVIIDCYKIETPHYLPRGGEQKPPHGEVWRGSPLWRINLGKNIRAGAHYTQFMVYDFDRDGHAELICKTAPGSIDGTGRYVTEAADDADIRGADNQADYRNERGRILSGPEYLTVFDGQTGRAIHTIYYRPNRAFGVGGSADYDKEGWGDRGTPGNRGERFLAGVAWLDGPNGKPSAIMCRGYYTPSHLWAVDFDGQRLSTKWLHASTTPHDYYVIDRQGRQTWYHDLKATAYGQGAHSLSVGDVDGDGCDEITYGSAAINNDGTLLYSTGLGHGDALHLSDLDPDRPGLEVFMVHESRPYGADLRDARTGELLFHETARDDTGRGVAADIDGNHRGFEYWHIFNRAVRDIKGNVISDQLPSCNFRIYWDGDLQDELLANRGRPYFPSFIEKWDGKKAVPLPYSNGQHFYDMGHSASCNWTKATPCLQADLFGDWREEVILWDSSDAAHLNIFTTNIPTPYAVPTLMHDNIYRLSICWQNTAYNQPPHLGYYLPDTQK
jgi:rhamnogalacturonan endolyase